MKRAILVLAVLMLFLWTPSMPQAEQATVSVMPTTHSPIQPAAYAVPIQTYTPQQTRSSSLPRRVPISVSNPTSHDFSGAVLVIINFPQGRAPYFGTLTDPSTYVVEVRDETGNLVTFQIDTDLTVDDGNNHALRLGVRLYVDVAARTKTPYYLYFDITPNTSRTAPSFTTPRSYSLVPGGYIVSDDKLSYLVRTAPIRISPTIYVLDTGIRQINSSTGQVLGVSNDYPLYEIYRSGVVRNVFYFYNYTYYTSTGVYIPVVPNELLSVINPNYVTNGRPYYGSTQDQVFAGAHGGYMARRILDPSSTVIPYSDYGRAFVGALYQPTNTANFDGSYSTDPTTANVAADPDFRNAIGRNASFFRITNSDTHYSYIAYSNGISTVSTISGTLYALYSPMHAIDNIYEHFSDYIEFFIYAPRTAAYTLTFGTDDNLRVRIDGKLVIDARALQGLTRYSTSSVRQAGSRHYVQIEHVEGPTRYDLHMKIKVTDPNDPTNVYVASQYIRLDSFAVPYSRAAVPNLSAGSVSIQSGPVFLKLSFRDAPVVPMRGAYPNVLDPSFTRSDIAYGFLDIDYYFLPNGDIRMNDTFTPKSTLTDDLAVFAGRPFSDNKPEEGISGATAAGNILIITGGSFSSASVSDYSYNDDSVNYALQVTYSNGASLLAVTSYSGKKLLSATVPLASFTDSSTTYPGDASPVGDKYEQKGVGFGISGQITGTVSRSVKLHVYVPNVTPYYALGQALVRAKSISTAPGNVESVNGLIVHVTDIDGNALVNATVKVYYLGYSGVNDTNVYMGENVTDAYGIAHIHTAIFTGNYSIVIKYQTAAGTVTDNYMITLYYSDIVTGTEETFIAHVCKLKIRMLYANGTPIEGPFPDITPTIALYYSGKLVRNVSAYAGVSDYIPSSYNYTLELTINVYGYNVTKTVYVVPDNDGSSLDVTMDVMPLEVSATVLYATTGLSSPLVGASIILDINGTEVSFYTNAYGELTFPVVPLYTNITVTAYYKSVQRGDLRIVKRIVPSLDNHTLSFVFKFRTLYVHVVDLDGKPVSSAAVTIVNTVVYTNATGYASLNVPDSSYYGSLPIMITYTNVDYLIPIRTELVTSAYVTSTATVYAVLPMRDITVSVVDTSGALVEHLYRITLYGSIGVIYDGYATGAVTFEHMNAEPSLALAVNVTIEVYGYTIHVSQPIKYVQYAQNTTVQLPIAMLTVHVNFYYLPDDAYEPVAQVPVCIMTNYFSTYKLTDSNGTVQFEYVPLSTLVGDYNVSVSVDVLGIEASEMTTVTIDQPREISLNVELINLLTKVIKYDDQPALADVKLYLDGHISLEQIVNASAILQGLPLKYVSNATFEVLYRTPYGYIVDERYDYTGLDLLALRTYHNVTLQVHIGDVSVSVPVESPARVTFFIGNVTVSLYGSNVTFKEIPYGTRDVEVTVYTKIAPVSFEYSVTVDEPSVSVSLQPNLATINLYAIKSDGSEIDARVTLSITVGSYSGSLNVRVPGNLTLTEMPVGNYSFTAVHVTPYGIPIYVNGTFYANGTTDEKITFNLADIAIRLTYPGSAEVSGIVSINIYGTYVSAYGSNVTFEEIPYGTRNVVVSYTNIAQLTYETAISVNASGVYEIYLPLTDVTIELKNHDGTYVSGTVTVTISGENLTTGSLTMDVVGIAQLQAVPIGTYSLHAVYTTPYGIPVEANVKQNVSTRADIVIIVPSGSFAIHAEGMNGKPIPMATVRIEFVNYSSIYLGTMANGSFVLNDFPYGIEIRVTVNGTFHGYPVRSTVDTISSENGLEMQLPLIDMSFRIIDQDTNAPAAGAVAKLYFNASGKLLLVASAVADENGTVRFERIPTEEFMSSVYGSGRYVVEIDYKGGTFYLGLQQVSSGEVVVNPPIPRVYIIVAVLAISLATASISAFYYKRRVLGPYHRLKSAIAKGREDIDLDRLPTREEELEEFYRKILNE